jgi:hypothetical protein
MSRPAPGLRAAVIGNSRVCTDPGTRQDGNSPAGDKVMYRVQLLLHRFLVCADSTHRFQFRSSRHYLDACNEEPQDELVEARMGWMIGVVAAAGHPVRQKARQLAPAGGIVLENRGVLIASGGPPETVYRSDVRDDGSFEIVLGSGFRLLDNGVERLSADAWRRILESDPAACDQLDGHFVIVRAGVASVEAQTDRQGLRGLFGIALPDVTIVSTRADWASRLAGGRSVNVEALGSHWLAFNKMNDDALLEGRLATGAAARYRASPGEQAVTSTAWHPAPTGEGMEQALRKLVSPVRDRTISLGLSGGMDSRLLLALVLVRPSDLRLHLFGPEDTPDAMIATQIASDLALTQRHLFEPLPPLARMATRLEDYCASTMAIAAASSAFKMNLYDSLEESGSLVIDGGFGEIGRRQFFNRLARSKKAASGDPRSLMDAVRTHRSDVFDPGVRRMMEEAAMRDVGTAWEALPADLSLDDRLDVLAIRTRLPHIYGIEQARLDTHVVNYMPFAQPSFLDAVFATPLRERRDSRAYRRLIRAGNSRLVRYPMVKGGATYPFAFSTVPAFALVMVKRQLGLYYRDHFVHAFLNTARSLVLDLAYSSETAECGLYDRTSLRHLVEGYYAGRRGAAADVDWWLALELWRRSLKSSI